jgi:hypothetical protein
MQYCFGLLWGRFKSRASVWRIVELNFEEMSEIEVNLYIFSGNRVNCKILFGYRVFSIALIILISTLLFSKSTIFGFTGISWMILLAYYISLTVFQSITLFKQSQNLYFLKSIHIFDLFYSLIWTIQVVRMILLWSFFYKSSKQKSEIKYYILIVLPLLSVTLLLIDNYISKVGFNRKAYSVVSIAWFLYLLIANILHAFLDLDECGSLCVLNLDYSKFDFVTVLSTIAISALVFLAVFFREMFYISRYIFSPIKDESGNTI